MAQGVLASLQSVNLQNEAVIENTSEYVEYVNPTLSEKIGNAHNKIICSIVSVPLKELDIDDDLIMDINTISCNSIDFVDLDTPSLCADFELDKVYDGELAEKEIGALDIKLEKERAVLLANQYDLESANNAAKEYIGNNDTNYDLDFLKEYVNSIVNIGNKDNIRLFTEEVNAKIDKLNISDERKFDLKAMIAIAENSYLLWNVKDI